MSDKEEDRGQERQQREELDETFYREPATIPTLQEFQDWLDQEYPRGENDYGI